MKRIAIISLAYLFSINNVSAQDSWLSPYSGRINADVERIEVPVKSYFEVPASKLGTAEYWLSDSNYLIRNINEYFGYVDFQCLDNEKMFLIRALYENGGTGRYRLYWVNSSLIVSHASLGKSSPPKKSALVVCLSKKPNAVYSSLSGAI
ncbi:hypothetical protein [Gilvimarinus japonicus]|uniref:Uncharacterized protein n=1 Tax=Gilvimarinus japonicus TaxID=1796469 RepID=A0ABV7HWH1_9GAMM